MGAKLFGASVRRKEDPRFLRGDGRYVDDIKLPGMLHAAFVRSPHGHARIVSVKTDAARRLPDVSAVAEIRVIVADSFQSESTDLSEERIHVDERASAAR